jgi:3-phenylpropionate/trans-cinnamate dioxygenase ferredoxin reductase subunit
MEVASSALALGTTVTVIDVIEPLVDRLGPVLAEMCLAAAADHGVKVRVSATGVRVGFDGGAPTRLTSTDGALLCEADLVITTAGDVPNTEWLRYSGLPVRSGVVVDSCCRVAPHIVAAGDVAAVRGPGGQTRRLPHWSNALSQAKIAAAALTATQPATLDDAAPQFFWTEMFGLTLRMAGGLPPVGAPIVVEGSLVERRAVLVWPTTATHLGTAVAINTPLSAPKLARLVRNTTQQLRSVR